MKMLENCRTCKYLDPQGFEKVGYDSEGGTFKDITVGLCEYDEDGLRYLHLGCDKYEPIEIEKIIESPTKIEDWKELLYYRSNTHYIMLKTVNNEFYLNDMSKLQHLYSVFPYCQNYKIDKDALFDRAVIISNKGETFYIPTHFIYWDNNLTMLSIYSFKLENSNE